MIKKEEEYFTKTMNLRYADKIKVVNEITFESQRTLQQMHQGSQGTQKWEWIKEPC